MQDDFLHPTAVAELLGLTKAALAQMRYQGRGPRYYKPTSKTVLYKRSEVVAWIEAAACSHSDQAAVL